LPEVPTIKELGFGTFDASTAYAVFAPKGVAREIIQQLNGEIAKALHNEEIANKLRAAGVEPKLFPPAEVTALLEAKIDQWARIIKSLDIQIR
jgi:tripartite-type tricarboxylate transporter receptor subunit TctC